MPGAASSWSRPRGQGSPELGTALSGGSLTMSTSPAKAPGGRACCPQAGAQSSPREAAGAWSHPAYTRALLSGPLTVLRMGPWGGQTDSTGADPSPAGHHDRAGPSDPPGDRQLSWVLGPSSHTPRRIHDPQNPGEFVLDPNRPSLLTTRLPPSTRDMAPGQAACFPGSSHQQVAGEGTLRLWGADLA